MSSGSRLHFKGGPWTNTDDQILLAALSSGNRDWERIASHLKKTATQCRERWENYLDPRLHLHEEWSVAEDALLVELHQLFPFQWKLISSQLTKTLPPHYIRPPWLCEKRYMQLRDLFAFEQQQQQARATAAAPEETNVAPQKTLEQFVKERERVWQAAQSHEEAPARVDTVSGGTNVNREEMLNVVVGRLANQDRKKGLRKERQRQLEEASFLATLQNQREAMESHTLSARQQKRMRKALEEDEVLLAKSLESGEEEEEEDEEEAPLSRRRRASFSLVDVGNGEAQSGTQAKPRVLLKTLTNVGKAAAASAAAILGEDGKRRASKKGSGKEVEEADGEDLVFGTLKEGKDGVLRLAAAPFPTTSNGKRDAEDVGESEKKNQKKEEGSSRRAITAAGVDGGMASLRHPTAMPSSSSTPSPPPSSGGGLEWNALVLDSVVPAFPATVASTKRYGVTEGVDLDELFEQLPEAKAGGSSRMFPSSSSSSAVVRQPLSIPSIAKNEDEKTAMMEPSRRACREEKEKEEKKDNEKGNRDSTSRATTTSALESEFQGSKSIFALSHQTSFGSSVTSSCGSPSPMRPATSTPPPSFAFLAPFQEDLDGVAVRRGTGRLSPRARPATSIPAGTVERDKKVSDSEESGAWRREEQKQEEEEEETPLPRSRARSRSSGEPQVTPYLHEVKEEEQQQQRQIASASSHRETGSPSHSMVEDMALAAAEKAIFEELQRSMKSALPSSTAPFGEIGKEEEEEIADSPPAPRESTMEASLAMARQCIEEEWEWLASSGAAAVTAATRGTDGSSFLPSSSPSLPSSEFLRDALPALRTLWTLVSHHQVGQFFGNEARTRVGASSDPSFTTTPTSGDGGGEQARVSTKDILRVLQMLLRCFVNDPLRARLQWLYFSLSQWEAKYTMDATAATEEEEKEKNEVQKEEATKHESGRGDHGSPPVRPSSSTTGEEHCIRRREEESTPTYDPDLATSFHQWKTLPLSSPTAIPPHTRQAALYYAFLCEVYQQILRYWEKEREENETYLRLLPRLMQDERHEMERRIHEAERARQATEAEARKWQTIFLSHKRDHNKEEQTSK